MTGAPCGEVAELPSDDSIWRLAKDSLDVLIWSDEQQRWLLRVPGNAIQFDPDLSTLWREHILVVHSRGPDAVCEQPPGRSILFQAVIGALIDLGLGVRHTPQEGEHGCAHVSFDRPHPLTKPERRELSMNIADVLVHVAGVITCLRPSSSPSSNT